MNDSVSRRALLQTAGAFALGSLIGGPSARAQTASSDKSATDATRAARKRTIRLAHLTDSHVQPERRADAGWLACIKHVQAQKDRPELVLTGGDLIMDGYEATFDRTKLQWELFLKVLKDECGLPVEHCLGNHDIWGWNKEKSGSTGREPQWGKKWALELLGLSKPYRSFDRAGWHFIVLDGVQPDPDGSGYIGKLDDEQFDWLAADLAKTPPQTPVLVLSHIPILSASALFDGGRGEETRGNWQMPASYMHIDARKIRELFLKHPSVKLCLSGHIHQVDRVEMTGVTYICDGAVSGAWWRGKNQGFPEGYGIVDLFDDGSFSHEYVAYNWQAEAG